MYPLLFKIGSIPVETYYVVWFTALSLMLVWTVRRLSLYGIDDGEGRRVLSWAFLGMLGGARAFEYVWNFPLYRNTPSLLLDLRQGGLSEVGAVLGATVTVLVLCRRNPKVPFSRLCDAACLPVLSAMALGRWGCFFAGCCVGIRSAFPFALHFPYDALTVTRHPTQLYYSFSAAAIFAVLFFFERRILRRGVPRGALLAPLGLILCSAMRLSIDPLRAEGLSQASGLSLSHWVLLAGLPLETVWFWVSWRGFSGRFPRERRSGKTEQARCP
ncbi:MAG: prolipoprotein diacylglyceryl transferase [Synergistaceae bacterium]|jgi:phosphatidylglycerol:prolipoprotein diacylglycerol transferase|nr:prolipoprotein diacylglyceryl transferase [Synergistaceae bacterium]